MRVSGIDITRSLAIFLAMSSHVYAQTGLGNHVPDGVALSLRVAMQFATPTFVLLFGTMLELVYHPRWASGQSRTVTRRLLKRALQCWILYALSIFCLFLVDDGYSWKFSIACVLFMGNSPYTEILKFYAVALALAPLLLHLRARIGLVPLMVPAVAYLGVWPLLNTLPDPQADLGVALKIARVIKFLTGFGSPPLAGPSILHGICLAVFGLGLGRLIAGNEGRTLSGRIPAAAVIALAAVLVCALFTPMQVFRGLSNMSLRMESNTVYFLAGGMMATCITLVLIWITDLRLPHHAPLWARIGFFGRTSMFTFAWGNMFLYLTELHPAKAEDAYVAAGLLILCICAASYVFDRAMRRSDGLRAAMAAVNRPLDRLVRLA